MCFRMHTCALMLEGWVVAEARGYVFSAPVCALWRSGWGVWVWLCRGVCRCTIAPAEDLAVCNRQCKYEVYLPNA